MNILIAAPRVTTAGQVYNFPLGLAYISAVLKERKLGTVHCVNLNHQTDTDEAVITRLMQQNQIDIFCTGGMSTHWGVVKPLFQYARKARHDVISIAGGALVTSEPELAISDMDFDIGVIGEGEETICELVSALRDKKDPSEVPGVITKKVSGGFKISQEREPNDDLDSLPLPDYAGFELQKLLGWMKDQHISLNLQHPVRLAEIISSRSCPFRCTFCYHPLGNKYRQRSLDNTFQEIELLVKEYGVNVLNLSDELFSDNPKRIIEFTDRIKQYNIRWIAQWRAPNIDPAIIKRLKDSGVLFVAIGLESPCDKILKSMKKGISRNQIEQALLTARQGGVWTRSNIILGDEADTVDSMSESIQWWLSHPEYDINIGFIFAVPKAPLYINAVKRGLITDRLRHILDGFPVINLSKAPDRHFNTIVSKVAYLNATESRAKSGQVLSSKTLPEKSTEGGAEYDLTVKCPYCGATNNRHFTRRKLEKPARHLLLQCFDCNARYKIRIKEAFPEEYNGILSAVYQGSLALSCFLMRFPSFRKRSSAWVAKIVTALRWIRNRNRIPVR